VLIPLGLWVGIIGYTVLYSGVIKLGGGKCSLGDAFRGKCTMGGGSGTSPSSTTTTAQTSANSQLSGIPSSPVGMA